MNLLIALVIVGAILFSVRTVQAENDLTFEGFMPAVMQSSLRIPMFGGSPAVKEAELLPEESSIQGSVRLTEIPANLDTKIQLRVAGLEPDIQFISVFHRNAECKNEDGSVSNSINGAFYGNEVGEASIEGEVEESINRIKSISIKQSSNFKTVSCIKFN